MVMASNKFLFLLLLISFLNSATAAAADPTYLYCNCSTNKTFTPNSAFQLDRTTLLSSLNSNATGNAVFYNATVAGGGDRAYGLFMCRGDVTPQVCHQCVANATQRITSECQLSKEAIIWYDECLLRYSNRSFFSTVATWPRVGLLNTANVSDQENFNQLLARTLNDVVVEAIKSGHAGTKNFGTEQANISAGTKQANISAFQTLYTLAQCTPDLSSQDCNRCLRDVIGDMPWCCLGKIGGRVLYPSCYLRFEVYPFYETDSAVGKAAPPVSSAIPPIQHEGKAKGPSRAIIIVVVVLIVVAVTLSCFACYFLRRKRSKSYKAILKENFGSDSTTLEFLQLSLATIEAATNKFSHENRIGKGGFGEVYKGILPDGREIAVKRLSRSSGQGAVEFKNEILLIAKLQHRNLVALLGFCLEEEEKILVYEYVPNKSLDYFLFGSQEKRTLNWLERYKIIGGTARGILYLHEYSRLKVIHRDLKPSNILLDDEMNPKISDFGMAKMVAINETEGSTNRIVGTYGYMSPEYAMFGQYSEKSDVFSFGVIVLEIVSGKKNASCHESRYVDGLLSFAWKQWRDEKLSEILDSNLTELGSYNEVIKCIQIGLLCVQENPDARPSMVEVVSYLSSDSIQLPDPQEPAFFMHGRMELNIGKKESSSDQYTNDSKPCSVNEMSTSKFFPR